VICCRPTRIPRPQQAKLRSSLFSRAADGRKISEGLAARG